MKVLRLICCFLVMGAANLIAQDSLENKTLKELDKLAIDYLRKGDTIKSRIYANYEISKAKQSNDSVDIAYAFYSHSLSKNIKEALAYCDSMIIYTKNSTNPFYPAVGYYMKAKTHYRAKQIDLALNNALIADSLAKDKNNKRQQLTVLQLIGNIYSHLGKYEEALEIHNEYYQKKLVNGWKSNKDHVRALFNISISFMKVKKRDSSRIFWHKAAAMSREINYEEFYSNRLVNAHAQIDYYDGNYNSSLDTLNKYRASSKENTLANNYYYSGKIYKIKNNNTLAIKFFVKMDSLLINGERPFYHAKDGYGELISIFKEFGDSGNQLKYIEKYLTIDSILTNDRETMDPLMLNKYQKPLLLKEKKRLLLNASKKQTWLNYAIVSLILVIIILITLFIRHHNLSKRIQLLMENGIENSISERFTVSENKQPVPADVMVNIEQLLNEFEKTNGFLEINLSQSSLAKKFETNSSYLSKYINNKKGKNFPSYIKGLRIKYAVESLKSEPGLLKYNIKGLAEKFGFQSADAFSRAFQFETSVKPSQFIKALMKKSINR